MNDYYCEHRTSTHLSLSSNIRIKQSHVESTYAANRTTPELKNPYLQSGKPDSRFSDQISKLEQSHHPSSSPQNKTKTNTNKHKRKKNRAKPDKKNSRSDIIHHKKRTHNRVGARVVQDNNDIERNH